MDTANPIPSAPYPTPPSDSGPPDCGALAQGTVLDDYTIDALLGVGGFGITYRGMDPTLKTFVAIKEYFPTTYAQRAANGVEVQPSLRGLQPLPPPNPRGYPHYYAWGLERFLQEGQTLAQIQHPQVVGVKRCFRAHGTAYLVMDYEEGETLASVLQAVGTLDEDDIRGLLADVLPALGAVHGRGYLHRDIKPANLYVRHRDGSVVLIDFGASKADLGWDGNPVTAMVSGGYSPPEQYHTDQQQLGPWTDIYALGGVLYQAMTGFEPPPAIQRLQGDELPAALAALEARYSPALCRLVARAMALDTAQRYPSVAAVEGALEGSKAEVGGRRVGPWLAGVLGVGSLVAGGWWWSPPPATPIHAPPAVGGGPPPPPGGARGGGGRR
ncbi:MAG: serine/threonine-protein kinase, partial [Candidatus Competibacterales bacterium]